MKILETTLRDGSYAVNFQFTAQDTAVISGALEAAGFELIEIGHGVGMGASQRNLGVAADTDEAYLKAAAGALKKSKFGMFCIPGVATIEHIDMAAQHGMGFVRVGTNVTEIEDSIPFIERAKKHGMLVCANFMKSYALGPREFAQKVKQSASFGADVVYLVDSAGGMLPSEVREYCLATKEATSVPLGFHGHDNLGLAVANSLEALACGAEILDTSLQGLGRSSGNAATELMVAVLARKGIDVGIDLVGVLDIGERHIRSLLRRQGLESLDVVAGYAQFHSSYMGVVQRVASRFSVDPRQLIIGVCARNKIDAPEKLVEEVAATLPKQPDLLPAKFAFDRYHGNEQSRASRERKS